MGSGGCLYRNGNWRGRITTPERAVAAIHSGPRVYVHNGCAEPLELVRALTRHGLELHDVEVVHTMTTGPADYTLPEYEGHIRHNSVVLRVGTCGPLCGKAGRPTRLFF